MSDPMTRVKKLVIKGGPLLRGSHEITEMSLGGQNLLENVNAFKLEGAVDKVIALEVRYTLVDTDIDLEGIPGTHVVMLQRTVRKMGPDMQMGAYKAWLMEKVGDSLPDALRRLADTIEKEGTPPEVVDLSTLTDTYVS